MKEYAVVGKRLGRIEGKAKVTGKAFFGADITLPGMLTGAILTSPYPHARILNIDFHKAINYPGVKAVVSAQDFPPIRYGRNQVKDLTVFAREKVRYRGERIAAVAAVDKEKAEEALQLIQVEYEELPGVFDPLEAMKGASPIIHEELAQYKTAKGFKKYGNVCAYKELVQGDINQGFKEADFILEDTFTTPFVHQGYIEPHAVMAKVEALDKVTVWTPAQQPFTVRKLLAEILDVSLSKIRVIGTQVGGAFGGKGLVLIEPIAVVLAQKTGRAVKIVLNREEEFVSTHPRAASLIQLKTGVKKDGKIIARQARVIFDTGAYAGVRASPLSSLERVGGPYRIPHLKIEGFCVYTNKIPSGHCRAPGHPQITFAPEVQMDILAHKLGIDPLEIRLKNGVEEEDLRPDGVVFKKVRFKETLLQAQQYLRGVKKDMVPGRGWGIACGYRSSGSGTSSALIRVNEDGSITLLTGVVDLTGCKTAFAQIIAEVLGISLESIGVSEADTDFSPFDQGAGGSRVLCGAGRAVKLAAEEVKEQLVEIAGQALEARAEEIILQGGEARRKGDQRRSLSFKELLKLSQEQGLGPIVGKGSVTRAKEPLQTFATHLAEVGVDVATGKVKILKYMAIHDLGLAINPLAVEGQIEGAVAQGVGFSLWENYLFEKGEVLNPSFRDYKMPTSLDLPLIQSILVEDEAGNGPFGAKSIAEVPITPVAAAISNAVFTATGVRIKDLPLNPQKVFQALKGKS